MFGPVGCSKYLADCQATNTLLFWSGALASASSAASVRPKAVNSQRPCSTKDPLCRVFVSGKVASKVRKTTVTYYTTFKTDLAPVLNQLVTLINGLIPLVATAVIQIKGPPPVVYLAWALSAEALQPSSLLLCCV